MTRSNPFDINDLFDSPFDPTQIKATRRSESAPPSPVFPAVYQPPLSKTEKRVLHLLLKGMTEKQAAEQLERSHNTVHVHVRNIYRKLGVSSRKMLYQLMDSRPDLAEFDEPYNAAA